MTLPLKTQTLNAFALRVARITEQSLTQSITIAEQSLNRPDNGVVLLVLPVEPRLLHPVKVGRLLDLALRQVVGNVDLVHVDRDQRLHVRAVQFREVRDRHGDQVVEDCLLLLGRLVSVLVLVLGKEGGLELVFHEQSSSS